MRFKYSGYQNGKKINGTIEADSIDEAKENLLNSGILISDIKDFKKKSYHFSKKISKNDLARVLNILGLYLRAHIPILNAINLTKSQVEDAKVISFLEELQKDIKEGKSFYNAVSTQKKLVIPPYIINSIKVGEETGKLDLVLIEMSKFLKDEDKITSKSLQALIYPFFIVVVSIFMISFMLTVVVPKIVKIFENLNQELPTITQFVINSGNFLQNNYKLILFLIIVFVSIFLYFYKKNYKFKFKIHSFMLKMPVIGKIIITKELGRFSYLVYILVNSGVNYLNALSLAINTVDNIKIKDYFLTALEDVKLGKKFSVALAKTGFDIDKSFISSIGLAEETGEISEIFQNVSEIYFEENESRIGVLLSIIEPTLIITIGVSIGFIVTALILPMFQMNMIQ